MVSTMLKCTENSIPKLAGNAILRISEFRGSCRRSIDNKHLCQEKPANSTQAGRVTVACVTNVRNFSCNTVTNIRVIPCDRLTTSRKNTLLKAKINPVTAIHPLGLQSELMLQLQLTSTATTGLLLAASFTVAAQSTSLDSLPLTTQDEISQVCLPVQFSDGAAAYRDCVKSELASRTNSGTTVFEQLSFDDKYAVQQACAGTGEQSSQNYQACVATQLRELNQIAAPLLGRLSEDELYVVQQSCFNAQSTQGAARYRQCLTDELQSLSGIPAADTSNLSMLNKNALQLRCSSNTSNVVQYRQCVADQYESVSGNAPSFLPAFTETQIPEVETPGVEIPEVEIIDQAAATSGESVTDESVSESTELLSNPTVVETQNIEQPAPTDIVALNNEPTIADSSTVLTGTDAALPADSDAIGEPASVIEPDAQTTVTDTANDSTGLSERASGAVSQNTEASSLASDARVISRPDLVESIEIQGQSNAQSDETVPGAGIDSSAAQSQNVPVMQKLNELWQKLLGSLSTMDSTGWLLIAGVLALPALLLGFFAMIRGLRRSPPAVPEYVAPNNKQFESGLDSRRLRHEQDAATLFDDDMFSDHDAFADHDAVTRIATKSEQQRASQRRPASANGASPNGAGTYGSGYHQASSAKSESNQIKRWVLKQDVFAFADVIGWLNTNATQKQLDQCVALLMALLVTEHSITPVQNTLLRFLSDAFNIGKQQLEQRFEKAFGHPMPPVPRTDKYAWWVKQQPEYMQRWEARFMATRAENEQMIARLGLTADYVEAQVINAFRRAARRCHPDRFTELGDRERALAEQQFIKFEQARDKLLGVSV